MYKITISKLNPFEGKDYNGDTQTKYDEVDIYEQRTDKEIVLMDVINAFNSVK
tara:strand:+ start:32900 stop:33058 length:159 start_codon:yes stop_codon:yes gene_type:complete